MSRIAMLGMAATTSAFLAEILLVAGELFLFESHPYIGIVTYMMLPALFVLGLLLIPLGVVLRLRKERVGFTLGAIEQVASLRRIRVGHVAQVIATLSLLNLVIFALVGYRAFHFTESITFCGETCHEVMEPEYVAYSRSPHSEVACVNCHIGPGADWYVKSKLSGARQFVAVLANSYSRPIETPVHNLRPARDVCEVCHRPEAFHGNLIKVIQHFESDEQNSTNYTVLNMRVGGGDLPGRPSHGIHWHVSKQHEVRYLAEDDKRERIVWVEQVNQDGTRRVWTNPDAPVVDPPEDELRVMDCVDCHNRPTHVFPPPESVIDEWLAIGRIDPTIPWVRKLAFELLTPDYATTDAAMAALASLPETYRTQYPEHWEANADKVRALVPVLQELHELHVFPEMNVHWNTYNSLIGHATPHTQACFRCHNGVLRDEAGTPITLDCRSCHFILANREPDPRILDRLQR